MKNKLKVAVITGVHQYDVLNFHKLFGSFPEIDPYIQNMFDFATDTGEGRTSYDVVVFYNMHSDANGNSMEAIKTREALDYLGTTNQGILLLHHSILAYRDNPIWNEITGINNRKFGYKIGEHLKSNILNPKHPITKGINSFSMTDETYDMDSADKGSEVLITTDHANSMKTIAWTRKYNKSRVLCLQSGHDNDTYENENFKKILYNGILWTAGRI